MAPAEPRRHAPREVRRAQILDAAQRCFAKRGYHRATMDDVVRACGLSKGSLYWHFRSKEELLLALFDRTMEEILGAWRPEDAEALPALDVVLAPGRRIVGALTADRELLGAWLEFFSHASVRARMADAYRETRALLESMLAQGVERGGVVAETPLAGMATAIIAAMEGLVLQAAVDEEFDAESHWAVLEAGLRRGFAT